MIDGVDETLGRKEFGFGLNVSLQREHVGGGKLAARFEDVIDPRGAPRRFPLHADGIRITVGSDSPIRRGDNSGRRVVDVRKLVERYVGCPLVGVVGAAYRETAVSSGADRNFAGSVVADVTVDVGID